MKIFRKPSTTHLTEANGSSVFAFPMGGNRLPLLLMLALGVCADFVPVSYTHLDVYKRQLLR